MPGEEDKARPAIARGLEGIVLCETQIADVNGSEGRLTIQGYDVKELAGNATFEEVAYLLWHGELPNAAQLSELKEEMASARDLPAATLDVLHRVSKTAGGMHALRMAAATLSENDPEVDDIGLAPSRRRAGRLLAQMPMIVGIYWRLRHGQHIPEIPRDAGVAATLLHLVSASEPRPEQVDALNAYLVAVSEHGLNASTFVGRSIVSTNADMVSALTGAIGALKGNAHGGVPGPVLDMMNEIGTPDQAEPWIRAHLAAGKRIMGFGHRIYKVRDPRAQVLADAADKLAGSGGNRKLADLTHAVETTTVRVLAEVKPGRDLYANVELFAALILHSIGVPSDLFTPVFAVGRTAGWTAHMIEQYEHNRLIRPSSLYTGRFDRKFVPLDER